MNLNKKLILITGGSSGIGKAAAINLAKQGAEIIIQSRDIEKLKTTAAEITNMGGKVHFISTDLTKPKDVEESAKKIINEIGLPDVIINSAGSGEWLSLEEASMEHYATSMQSPYLATAYTCKAFNEEMLKRGGGHLININSAACYFSFSKATGYTAARWAMLGFTKSLQADLYNTNLKVSMIAFGKVDSPYFKNNPKSEDRIPRIVKWLIPTVTTDYCGKIIANTIKSKKSTVIRPPMMLILATMNRYTPGMFRWIIRITNK